MDFGTQTGTYFVGLFIVGCLYASTLFSDLASKPKGINYLSLPASQLEKTLCALFYGVIIFFVAYTIVFYVADFIMVKVANGVAFSFWEKNHSVGEVFTPQKIINIFNSGENSGMEKIDMFQIFLLTYFAIQSAYILGSVYFTKFSFIKTTISLLLVVLFIILFIGKILDGLLPHGSFYQNITSYQIFGDEFGDQKIIRLPEWVGSGVMFFLKYAFAPIFWTVTFFRVKEKEI
jgi:hypothetical protein